MSADHLMPRTMEDSYLVIGHNGHQEVTSPSIRARQKRQRNQIRKDYPCFKKAKSFSN